MGKKETLKLWQYRHKQPSTSTPTRLPSNNMIVQLLYLTCRAGIKNFLRYPKRELTVNFPVRMDNGDINIFTGYRVHHNTVLGPSKGGIRQRPPGLDEACALAMWMT